MNFFERMPLGVELIYKWSWPILKWHNETCKNDILADLQKIMKRQQNLHILCKAQVLKVFLSLSELSFTGSWYGV